MSAVRLKAAQLYRASIIAGILIIGLAAFMPWLTSISLIDVYRNAFSSTGGSPVDPLLGSGFFSAHYVPTVASILMALVLYPASIAVSLLSIRSRILSLPGGCSGLLTCFAWVFGTELLKDHLSQEATGAGSSLSILPISTLAAGYGAYLVAVGGAIIVAVPFILSRFEANAAINSIASGPYGLPRLEGDVMSLLHKWSMRDITVVDRRDRRIIIEAVGQNGEKFIMLCEFRFTGDPVGLDEVHAFTRTIEGERQRRFGEKIGGGIYLTNSFFAAKCRNNPVVELIDGVRIKRHLRSR